MLIHYFGSREALEELAMARLEDRLRARFRAGSFPAGTPLRTVVTTLWDQITAPHSRGILLLTMDLTRRSWSGSDHGKRFFEEQQLLWSEMLKEFLPDRVAVETLLQLFQGAALVYLVTGDRERGRRALERFINGLGLGIVSKSESAGAGCRQKTHGAGTFDAPASKKRGEPETAEPNTRRR